MLYYENRLPEAERVSREALDAERRVLGPEHSDTLVTQNSLGLILKDEHRYPEAESVLRDTLALRTKVYGAHHPDTAESEYSLAELYAMEGKKDEAFTHLGRCLDDGPKPDLLDPLATDPHFKSLQSDPRLTEVIARDRKLAGAPPK